jgi:TRAP-type C4-dicarboxylate transport system permease small subunit
MRAIVGSILFLSRGLAVIAGVATFLIMLLIAADVVMRYLGSGVPGTLVIVTYYLMLVVAFLSIARVEQRDAMISVDALYDALGPAGRRWMMAFATALVTLVYAGIAYASLQEALKQFAVGAHALTLTYVLSIWPAYFIVPVAFAVAALIAGLRLVLLLAWPRVPPDLRAQLGLHSISAARPEPGPRPL